MCSNLARPASPARLSSASRARSSSADGQARRRCRATSRWPSSARRPPHRPSRMVAGFPRSAREPSREPDDPLDEDVILCGDDVEAKAVARRAGRNASSRDGLWTLVAFEVARWLEPVTAVLLNVNRPLQGVERHSGSPASSDRDPSSTATAARGRPRYDRTTIESRISSGDFFWLDFGGTPRGGDFTLLRDVFRFHPLALEDSEQFGQRPKLEDYGSFVFMVVYGAAPPPGRGPPSRGALLLLGELPRHRPSGEPAPSLRGSAASATAASPSQLERPIVVLYRLPRQPLGQLLSRRCQDYDERIDGSRRRSSASRRTSNCRRSSA